MSIWFKPLEIKVSYPVSTGGILQPGLSFALLASARLSLLVTLPEYRYDCISVTQLTINQWYLLTGTVHPAQDTRMFLNGRLEKELTPFAQKIQSSQSERLGGHVGHQGLQSSGVCDQGSDRRV